MNDMEIISVGFTGSVIRERFGKVSAILFSSLNGISYKRWYVHVGLAFPLAHHYREVSEIEFTGSPEM